MKALFTAVAVAVALQAGSASAAVPEFGSPEGELACFGLVNLGLAGASASKPAQPQIVSAMAMALGFYLGRLSKIDPNATMANVDAALGKLTLEEKNVYANQCLKKASQLMPLIR
jgi:hypothetical protein